MMNNKPTLLIMAAGRGSATLTPAAEVMLEVSAYDALNAGFEKIVPVITREGEADFEARAGRRLRRLGEVAYAYQEVGDLPAGIHDFPERKKPWGTAQAIWAARNLVDGPFAVVNAGDYYGAQAFCAMHDFLENEVDEKSYGMIGYLLGNTLADEGTVARGICEVQDGYLVKLTERRQIARRDGKAAFRRWGERWTPLELETPVSMQFFGFHPSIMNHAEAFFANFLQTTPAPMTSECLLPALIGQLVAEKMAAVRVLLNQEQSFGLAHALDKQTTGQTLAKLRLSGHYPASLWEGD
jgi:hypothetical protein